MHTLKKIGAWLSATLFSLLLFQFLLLLGISQAFGTAQSLKQAVDKSGIYETFVSKALAQATKDQQKQTQQQKPGQEQTQQEGIPLGDPNVQKIIQDAVPPDFLRGQVSGVIDNVYAWANGDSALNFTVDLSTAKTRLADSLTEYVTQKATTLPPCDPAVSPDDFDIFNASCTPRGLDNTAISNQIHQQILGGEFLKDPTFSANDIKNDKGQTLNQQFHAVPGAFNLYKLLLIASGVGALLFGVGLVFLSSDWRRGLKRAGVIMISVGLTSTAIAGFLWWGTGFISQQLGGDQGEIASVVASLVSSLTSQLGAWWLSLGAVTAILGFGIVLTLRLTAPKAAASPKTTDAKTADEPDQKTSAETSKTKLDEEVLTQDKTTKK